MRRDRRLAAKARLKGEGVVDDNNEKVVTFPSTDEERKALRREKQDQEKQKLINLFVDETGGLFHTPNGDAYADLIINGHRETWPVRSKKFRIAYIKYL